MSFRAEFPPQFGKPLNTQKLSYRHDGEIIMEDIVETLRYLAREYPDAKVVIPNEPEHSALKAGEHDLSTLLQYLADMVEE